MEQDVKLKCKTLVFLFAGILAAAPALADKPSWNGGDKGERRAQGDQQSERRGERDRDRREYSGRDRRDEGRREEVRHDEGRHFNDKNRRYIRDYYFERYEMGRCPPGLMRKHNGCMPPGQAKKWMVGRPLPPGVVYYDLPPGVVMQLGPPPRGHRYVRVAGDILMIAIGTAMVMDAIEDLGRY